MNGIEEAEKVLEEMLGRLGFSISVERCGTEEEPCLNITSDDSGVLIGKGGDRLEDIQYLVNRITSKRVPDLPRVKIDCDFYRKNQERELLENVGKLADKVKADGRSARTRPLNAYYRRLVHNYFLDDNQIETTSPEGSSRFKRIQISRKES